MRAPLVAAAMLVIPAFPGGVMLAAQAVERSDVPGRGMIRVTFDPRIMTWDSDFTDAGRVALGRGLTGDTVGGTYIPAVARLEQQVRAASGLGGFVASLGMGRLSVRQERRTYPVTTELGLTDRLSLSLMVPIVRTATRAALRLSPTGANLGLNPLTRDATAYATFFRQFDSTLTVLDQNIAAGQYGCDVNPNCTARSDAAQWHGVRDALYGAAYGAGRTGSPFMVRDSSAAGQAIDSTVARIQRQLSSSFGISGFDSVFALATDTDTLNADLLQQVLITRDSTGFGYAALPFHHNWRYALGDVELAAKYRVAAGARYAAALVALVRLPTGQRDSADELLYQTVGDHQLDLEGRVIQELTVGPVWLNVAVRAGVQRPGTRVRRVAPWDALLVPATATADLRWDPGDYLGVDVAPLVRLAPQFAAGFTAGYWTKTRDHYAFQSPQDSIDLAGRLGVPTSAGVLDAGTSERRLRLGFALSYVGRTVEGGFSIEQTVTGAGDVPAATVYRIVFRTARKLF
jgi:hypothetical protein